MRRDEMRVEEPESEEQVGPELEAERPLANLSTAKPSYSMAMVARRISEPGYETPMLRLRA